MKREEFKVGDTVEIIGGNEILIGEKGEITWLLNEKAELKLFNQKAWEEKPKMYYENLKKIQEEKVEEFKVGDKIIGIREGANFFKKIGKVLKKHTDTCTVDFDGEKITCGNLSIKKIESEENKNKQEHFELKEGMKFKTLDFDGWNEKARNKVFTVKETDIILNNKRWLAKEYQVFFLEKDIDWEETRKLNEVEENKKVAIIIDLKAKGIFEKFEKLGYVWLGGKKPTEWKPQEFKYIYMNKKDKTLTFSTYLEKYDYAMEERIFLNNYMIEQPKEEIKKPKQYMVWRTSAGSPTMKHDSYEKALEEAKRLANKTPNVEFNVVEVVSVVKGIVQIEVEEN